MKRIQKQMDKCLAQETNMSKKQIKKLMVKNSDTYITANEAVKRGIVDSLI
jgi:ATP-dependent protease ClpP protease subunit